MSQDSPVGEESAHSSQEEEENFEELDMLCDGVEADQHLEKNKEFAKAMNSKMDEKLEKIKQAKLVVKEQEMEKIVKDSVDYRSQILLRDGTRTLTEDEIMGKVGSR